MQQTAVLERGLDHRTRVDHQPQDVSNHAVAKTAELVARASLGDQVAWDQLVERCGAMMWAVARGHGLGLNDAADVRKGDLAAADPLVTTATREAVRMRRLRGGGVPSPPSMTWSDPRPGIGRRVLA